jgi:outer membrane protein assembly factor BamE (lipoprotein component of BamABCDE complex)
MYSNYPLGRYPSGQIKDGMSPDEVIAILGAPHHRDKSGDSERWFYWLDSYGINWFSVRFGPDGKVSGTSGN